MVVFPCNQFGAQEPGTPEKIKAFAEKKGATFPVMGKIDVNGPGTDPVYNFLKGPDGADIRWNFFTKFVVKCSGDQCSIVRYDGAPNPQSLEDDINKLLQGQARL